MACLGCTLPGDINFGRDLGIANWWNCICTTSCLVGKMIWVQWFIYDLNNSSSTALFSKIPRNARACMSSTHICVGICDLVWGCLLGGKSQWWLLTALTSDHQFDRRNELLRRLVPPPVSSRLALVRCVPVLIPMKWELAMFTSKETLRVLKILKIAEISFVDYLVFCVGHICSGLFFA